MIGNVITGVDGVPLDGQGNRVSPSDLKLTPEVSKFFLKFQTDYINAWQLQRKPLDEFDGYSLLDRAKLDQETFAAYVGIEYVPKHKKWRWRGRKNTARNKLIGILAHLIAGMLFPYVHAQNDQDEEDKMTARAMAIMVEEHLRRAGYEMKFLYLVLSALVNPATYVHVEFASVLQKVKEQLANGEVKITEVLDDVLSGTQLHTLPIDEILLGDLYSGTGSLHRQPHIFRVRRISYDVAKGMYSGRFFDENGKDLFDYVEAGKTRFMGTNDQLFDVDYTEADGNYVQEVTGFYRTEDLEVPLVGGVPMCNHKNVYNTNPFNHRRMVQNGDSWITVPIYPFAMSGFEPIDPTGRFVYYKSGAFKEYWEDKKINEIDRLLVDGVKLDVLKPMFLSGVAKMDSTVIAPSATVSLPLNAKAEAYSLGPNLAAAYKVIQDANVDIADSTQDKVMEGKTTPGITATQTVVAERQARIFLGVSGLMIADLIRQVGELTMDNIIQNCTIGELDANVPESMRMKFRVFMAKGKDKGRNVNHRIEFTDKLIGRNISPEQARLREWQLFERAGGKDTDQRIWEINPYRFARTRYSMFVDADKIIMRSMGADKQQKDLAFQRLTDPRVMPFTDPEAVVNDFVIEEYSNGDPDRYKAKKGQEEMMQALLGMSSKSEPSPEQLPEQISGKI